MDRITLENYRCFREKQTARLAPLTLLVGNNSTGKTSFLAIVRELWRVAVKNEAPDFREIPYDLGTFSDIAHNRGGRSGQAGFFKAGFGIGEGISFDVTFKAQNANPFPVARRISQNDMLLEAELQEDGSQRICITPGNINNLIGYDNLRFPMTERDLAPLTLLIWYMLEFRKSEDSSESSKTDCKETSPFSAEEIALSKVLEAAETISKFRGGREQPPFAGAPIQSRPRRTYDPIRSSRDPEGEGAPTHLASLVHHDKKEWTRLKAVLEEFGRDSGLFDEIDIKLLGTTGGSPFQVQIRKFGRRLKGPKRNLIDVGYGVSQALPLLTELLRKDATSMFLLQQPEVHLHPSAQAALGSLFCKIAGPERQLIVETHSDYILDRVRMDIRDKKTDLKPEHVSILFFESGELDVTIHSLRLDEDGNISNEPEGYRQFFLDETRRFIGI